MVCEEGEQKGEPMRSSPDCSFLMLNNTSVSGTAPDKGTRATGLGMTLALMQLLSAHVCIACGMWHRKCAGEQQFKLMGGCIIVLTNASYV